MHGLGTVSHGGGTQGEVLNQAQDAQAVFRQVFEEPGVDDVEAVIRVAFGPAVPGKSPRLIALRSDEFRDFGFDGEAEGLEAKSRIGGKLRALRVVEFDVGYIVIVRRPDRRVNQIFKGFFGSNALDDDFVRSKNCRSCPAGMGGAS